MSKKHQPTDPENLRDSASRVRRSGALGTGRVIPDLFQYLVEMALKGEVPKEFDIATDVFGKDARYQDGGDAQIRVWIYRLRSRLDGYYAGAGRDDPFRLDIPKGTYRIAISPNRRVADPPRRAATRSLKLAGGALGVIALLAVVASAVLRYPGVTAQQTVPLDSVWSGIARSDRPLLVVVGDHFFFGELDSPIRIRDIRINSEEELRNSTEFRANPGLIFDTLSYLPKSVAFGLDPILPRVRAARTNTAIKLVSELTSEDLRDYDIVYLGFIRSMGILRDFYLTRSNFLLERPYLDIVHADTGQVFARSGPLPKRNRDYGLFARFLGPAGNEILVFSGIGDPGVLAAARGLNDAGGIAQVEQLIKSSEIDVSSGWEALLEVDGHSRTDLDFRVVSLLPIEGRGKVFPELPSMNAGPNR